MLKVLMILPIGKSKAAGFTLIELLLVMVLIGVMLGMSIASFAHGPRQRVQQFSRQMVMDFHLAQTTAVEKASAVSITFDAAANEYTIQLLSTPTVMVKRQKYLTNMQVVPAPGPLLFLPDGSSSPMSVELIIGQETFSVSNAMHRFQWTIEHADTAEVI